MLVLKVLLNKVYVLIIKKIYFQHDSYGQNKSDFKKLLSKYSIVWDKRLMRFHNVNNKQVMTGVYSNSDGYKKVAAVYEGSGKPATMVVKTIDSGGAFLVDIIRFCFGIGCTIEDKDDRYAKDFFEVMISHGDIGILDRKEYTEISGYDKRALDARIDVVVKREVDKYMNNVSDIYNQLGYNLRVVKYFKEMDIRVNIISMLDHRLDRFVFAELN